MSGTQIPRRALAWGVAALGAFVGQTAMAQTAVSALREGDLVLSEVMINPSGDNTRREWFEVYNATTSSVDLQGLVITGKTGETQTVSSSVVVAARDYALFAVKSTNNGDLPTVDYVYTRSVGRFDNGTDTISISYDTTTFDTLSWTSSGDFHATLGYSLQLDPWRNVARVNDNAEYWCEGQTSYGAGGYGTPGSANEDCGITTLSIDDIVAGDLVITEVMVNPSTSDDARREWFEIYNAAGVDINLNGLVLSDGGTDSYTIGTDTIAYYDDVILLVAKDKYNVNGMLPKADVAYNRNLFRFDNSDEIYLSNSAGYIDQVMWRSSGLPAEGTALSLDPDMMDATSNDDTANWCGASSTYGSGDYGTPQVANDDCP